MVDKELTLGYELEFNLIDDRGVKLKDVDKQESYCREFQRHFPIHPEENYQVETITGIVKDWKRLEKETDKLWKNIHESFGSRGWTPFKLCDKSSQHIHVGLNATFAEKVKACDAFFEYIPALTAMCANTPYKDDYLTDRKSVRIAANEFGFTSFPSLATMPAFKYARWGNSRELVDFEIRSNMSTIEIRLSDAILDKDFMNERAYIMRSLVKRALKEDRKPTEERWKQLSKARFLSAIYGNQARFEGVLSPQDVLDIAKSESDGIEFPLTEELVRKNYTFADIAIASSVKSIGPDERLKLNEAYTQRSIEEKVVMDINLDKAIDIMVENSVKNDMESTQLADLRSKVGIPLLVLEEVAERLTREGKLRKVLADPQTGRFIYASNVMYDLPPGLKEKAERLNGKELKRKQVEKELLSGEVDALLKNDLAVWKKDDEDDEEDDEKFVIGYP